MTVRVKPSSAPMRPEDLEAIASLVASKLPPPAPPKSILGNFLAGYGGLMLTIVLATVGYIFGLGAQADRIANIQASVADLRSNSVTTSDLNARLGEIRAGQEATAKAFAEISDRLARLESRAMNGSK